MITVGLKRMFRRTAEDLKRAASLLAEHPPDYVIDRFVIEGMPRGRAEWLARRAREERRKFQLEKPRPIVDWDSRGIVPEELKAAPPRSVRVAKSVMLPFLVLAVTGAATLAVGIWQVAAIRQLRQHGIETRGRVGSGKVSLPYTMVRYRYQTPIGVFRDMSIVPWSVFRRLETGQTIVVSYARSPWLMSRPFPRTELDWLLTAKIAGFQIFAGIFFLAFSPYFARMARRTSRTDIALATHGAVAVGEVLSIRSMLRVRYRFRAGNRDIESEAGLRRPPSVLPQKGDRIVIVYDLSDPSRNVPADALNVEFAS